MALDLSTLDTDTPQTKDGRRYPDRLRPYEDYDGEFLPLIKSLEPASANELLLGVGKPRLRSVLSRWIASAEWRDLIQRRDDDGSLSRRTYVLGEHGRRALNKLG